MSCTPSTAAKLDALRAQLLAHDPLNLKGIVYEMRFDEVSAKYADFGEFFIGMQVPLDELFRRIQL